jgi:DHA1 family multidrug resistance protein-like MFS transporter
MVESIGASLAIPSAQSLVAQFVPAGQLGRAQGMVTTGQTAATAVSAMVAGSLFGIGPAVPFIVIAVVAISFPPLVAYLWRDVEGHSHHHEAKDTRSR